MPKLTKDDIRAIKAGKVQVMTAQEAAVYLGVSVRTLQRLAQLYKTHIRTSLLKDSERAVRYRLENLRAFVRWRHKQTRRKEQEQRRKLAEYSDRMKKLKPSSSVAKEMPCPSVAFPDTLAFSSDVDCDEVAEAE